MYSSSFPFVSRSFIFHSSEPKPVELPHLLDISRAGGSPPGLPSESDGDLMARVNFVSVSPFPNSPHQLVIIATLVALLHKWAGALRCIDKG